MKSHAVKMNQMSAKKMMKGPRLDSQWDNPKLPHNASIAVGEVDERDFRDKFLNQNGKYDERIEMRVNWHYS